MTVIHVTKKSMGKSENSYDVFISYAWADNVEVEISDGVKQQGFVSKLYKQLSNNAKKEVWWDRVKIPDAAPITEEFLAGLQKSDNIVLVLSPQYIASDNCQKELTSALNRNKRIIPIVRQEVNFADLPPSVKDIKFIFFENDADFETSFAGLVEAIDTDPVYKRSHTRLLTRAEDWDGYGRNNSYLLRGIDLRNAETLQVESASQKQKFTALQLEYILASRQASNSFLRKLMYAVAIALVIIFGLFVQATRAADSERIARQSEQVAKEEAINQRNEAVKQRNQAQRTAQTFATVDNTSKQPVGGNAGRPVLIGTELWVVSRAEGTVWRLRADTGERIGEPIQVGSGPRDPVYDGQWLWISTANQLVRLNPAQLDERQEIAVGRYAQPPLIAGEWLWALSGDDGTLTQVERQSGTVVKTVNVGKRAHSAILGGGYVWVMNPETRQLVRVQAETGAAFPIEVGDDPQQPVFAGGTLWLVERDAGKVRQLEADTGQTLTDFTVAENLKPPVAAGAFVWILSPATQEVIQIEPAAGTEVRRFNVGVQPRNVFVDGETLWLFTDADKLFRYQLATGERLSTLVLSSGAENPVLDSLHLWLTDVTGSRFVLIRRETGEIVRLLPDCPVPLPPVFDGANMWAICQADNQIARIPALMSYSGLGETRQNTEPSAPVYDGKYIWISQAADQKVVQFDADNGLVLADIPVGDTPLAPVFDGQYLWVAAQKSNQVTRIDTTDPRNYMVIPVGDQPQGIVRTGEYIWVTGVGMGKENPYDLTWIDRQTGKILDQFDSGMGAMEPVTDGTVLWISAASFSGGIYQVDAATGKQLSSTKVGPLSYPVVLDGDHVWVVSLFDETLLHIVEKTQGMVAQGFQPMDVPGKLYRLNRSDGTITGELPLETFPSRPLLAGGKLWITQNAVKPEFFGLNERGVMVIDPRAFDDPTADKVVAGWSPCLDVTQPIYAGQFVWIGCQNLNDETSTVLAINPETLAVTREYHDLGLFALPAKQIEDTVWVVFQDTGNAAVFDADTGALLRVLGLGKQPTPPVYDGQRFVWISNTASGTVQRIDFSTLRAGQ